MTTFCEQNGKILIGADFVSAVSGVRLSHGSFTIGESGITKLWESCFDQEKSLNVLRQMAKAEGIKSISFMSQAI